MRTQTFISSMVGIAAAVAVVGSANAAITTIDNFGVAITGQGNGSFTAVNTITGPFTKRSAYNNSGSIVNGNSSIAGTGNGVASLSVARDAISSTSGAALWYFSGVGLDLSQLDSGFSLTISNLVNPNYARVAVNVNAITSSAYTTVSSNGVLTISRASIEAGMGSTNWAAITKVNVYFYGAGGAAGTSTFDVSNFQAIPAPGALALLGLAGLVAGRRRRN